LFYLSDFLSIHRSPPFRFASHRARPVPDETPGSRVQTVW
jgi:hypothetical protein